MYASDDDKDLIKVFNDVINGRRGLAKPAHTNYGNFFKERDYMYIEQCKPRDDQRHLVSEFFCTQNEFSIGGPQTKDLYTVFKYTGNMELSFSACFFVC
jgi:hypothetical protein